MHNRRIQLFSSIPSRLLLAHLSSADYENRIISRHVSLEADIVVGYADLAGRLGRGPPGGLVVGPLCNTNFVEMVAVQCPFELTSSAQYQ